MSKMDEKRFCGCKCHPPTGYMEVCRECCVGAAKDDAFETMMKQNATVLKLQAEKDALVLQLSEWRKCGAMLRDDIGESLAREGMGLGDTPASHYSDAFNMLLKLLKEAK